MKKRNFQSDKSLMEPINCENTSQLKKIKQCKGYHFKESEEVSDSSNHYRGSTGSVFKSDAC
ncbi:hypothetical protein NB16F75_12780 [Escherichia coli]